MTEIDVSKFKLPDYQSPFKLPLQDKKCSNPDDHRKYPGLHSDNRGQGGLWGRECPVHGPTARNISRSSWARWAEERENFATNEFDWAADPEELRRQALNRMLGYVTESCPPDNTGHNYMKQHEAAKRDPWYKSEYVHMGFFLAMVGISLGLAAAVNPAFLLLLIPSLTYAVRRMMK